MPKVKETVHQNDTSEAETGSHKPKTPGKSQENKSFHLDDRSPGRSRILSLPWVVLNSWVKGIESLWLKCP